MSILNKIRDCQKTARLNKHSELLPIYTTLLGEAIAIGKNKGNRETTDEECVSLIKKFISNLEENIGYIVNSNETTISMKDKLESINTEMTILKELLPSQLTVDEIKSIFIENSNGWDNLGKFMKYMKQHYVGKYDGALAAKIYGEYSR